MQSSQHDREGDGSLVTETSSISGSTLALPPPPEPSADQGISPPVATPSEEDGALPEAESLDIFTLAPVAALRMLCDTVETLVQMTGDVPPTPPLSTSRRPGTQIIQALKENTATYPKKACRDRPPTPRPPNIDQSAADDGRSTSAEDHADVPSRAKTPIGSPEAHPTEPLRIVGSDMEPLDVQHGAIARKFYSKKPPPIPLKEYLFRLHKYCPMSTAVYLATSLYIHRLAIVESILPVTARNVHRLLLAGLRVAMKALEDLSYPHRRFAKVGGVTESELGRLEVSFCFVTNFELKVTSEMLLKHAKSVRDGQSLYELPNHSQPYLPRTKSQKELPLRQSITAVQALATAAPAGWMGDANVSEADMNTFGSSLVGTC